MTLFTLRRRPISVVLGLCIIVGFGAAQNSSDTAGTCSQGNLGNNTIQLSGSNGTFFSPNYPAQYKNGTICIWIISVPTGKRVILRINSDFEVDRRYTYPSCAYLDFVEMRDGNSSKDRLLGDYCGNGPLDSKLIYVQSTGNSMWVTFISNHDELAGTFKAYYEAIEAVEVACTYSGWTYDASLLYNQTLTSSKYPARANHADCSGTFRASNPSGYIVKIVFKSDFRLGYYSYCTRSSAYLEFFDGPNSSSPSIGKFCGYVHPEVMYSTGRYLNMKFVGDSWPMYRGFSFNYTAVLEDENSGMCLPNQPANNNLQLNGSSGTFFTPNYPVDYKDGTRCTWRISVPAGKRIRLTFSDDFHVSTHYSDHRLYCLQDYVEVLDGSSSSSRQIGRYCGYSRQGFVESSGNFLLVRFRSNYDGYNGDGFKAHYSAVEDVAVACAYSGWTYDASTLHNQTLTSSHYPQYGRELACSGTFRTTNVSGNLVKIVFNDFQLGYEYHRYCYTEDNFIQFYDGPSSSSKLIGTFCGDTFPEVVYSSGRYLHINYVTERRYVTGFSLNYTAVPEGEVSGICSPIKDTNDNLQLSGSSGTLFTPNYPVPSMYGTTCIWVISAELGKKLKLNFTDFDLHFTNNCSEDFVEIRDGNSATSRELGKYCGSLKGLEVESTGNYLRVMFQSSSANDASYNAGFKAEYQAIDIFKADSINDHPKLKDEASKSNKSIVIRVVVGVAVFIGIMVIVICIAVKLRKTRDQHVHRAATEEVVPLTPSAIITVSQSTPASLPASVADDPPPPYPAASPVSQGEGGETVPSIAFQGHEKPPPPYPPDLPQYPPPGELYPWQQSLNDGSQASWPTQLHDETSL